MNDLTSTDPSSVRELMDWFGVDEARLSRVLSEALSHGGGYADLYFEHSSDSSIAMEGGIISRASTSVDRGVGIRVLVGDQTGYAYSEALSLNAMLGAARTAASIARSNTDAVAQDLTPTGHVDLYRIGV